MLHGIALPDCAERASQGSDAHTSQTSKTALVTWNDGHHFQLLGSLNRHEKLC